jgi:hypothetical protein
MFGPGEMNAILPVASMPESRLHFAGCHTSPRPGFMHGAIASAKRVVAEIATGLPPVPVDGAVVETAGGRIRGGLRASDDGAA